ncbi:helix-turn-helix domain-containing protein [Cloacibacillus evryensis]|uniref:helix-turn-helix domain-containing protein n=1 Tax=Cloacibacillus evryensis TaxID=508460 RepID=UPI00044E40D0|nr:LexA family transcriptional regulator [Cloacibacillus evryensis]EXG78102.1 SOS response transcriptional repressor, RecA-mediated autopeptidase [Cloacibacillus evryensis DSM 19522]MEA5034156.1 helix-turn-helix domain-containing protein [Cloacibacillus evryensis]
METFGARLSRLRREKGLKRHDIAEPLGVDAETIARYEREEREPKVSDAVTIANILGVSIEYLSTGIASPQTHSVYAYGVSDRIIVPVLSSNDSYNLIPSADLIAASTEHIIMPKALIGNVQPHSQPFAIVTRDKSFEKFAIREGSYVVINPAERVANFDIALVFYKGKLTLKRPQYTRHGALYLFPGNNSDAIYVSADDAADINEFKIIGKAVAYQFEETKKIYHNI